MSVNISTKKRSREEDSKENNGNSKKKRRLIGLDDIIEILNKQWNLISDWEGYKQEIILYDEDKTRKLYDYMMNIPPDEQISIKEINRGKKVYKEKYMSCGYCISNIQEACNEAGTLYKEYQISIQIINENNHVSVNAIMGGVITHLGKYTGEGCHIIGKNREINLETINNAVKSAKSKALRRLYRNFGNMTGLVCWKTGEDDDYD